MGAPCWDRRRPRLLVAIHVLLGNEAGEDACGPSIGAPVNFQGTTKGNRCRREPVGAL